MSRIPYTNKVGETIGSIADPAAAYSLRALNGGDPMVARVRRSSDDAEKDFTASAVSGGALVDWVNEDIVITNAAFTNIGGSYDTFSGSSSSGFTATNTASDGRALSNLTISTPQVGDKFRINYNLTLNSGSGITFLLATSTGSSASSGVNVTSSGTGSIELTANNLDVATLRVNAIENVDFVLSGLSVTAIQSSGHVTTWYDQSGNGNNATQSTAGSQPKIVDAGVLVSDGIEFDGVDDFLSGTDNGSLDTIRLGEFSCFGVAKLDSFNSYASLFNLSSSPSEGEGALGFQFFRDSPLFGPHNTFVAATGLANVNLTNVNNESLFTLIRDNSGTNGNGSNVTVYVKDDLGISLSNSATQGWSSTSGTNYYIGSQNNVGEWSGKISEIIIYNSDQSSNRFKIESNINNHYDLYTNANDGHVTTWYDQSGNDNHATQVTAGRQPKIVDGGTLVSDGIDFNGAEYLSRSSFTQGDLEQPNTIFSVAKMDSNDDTNRKVYDGKTGDGRNMLFLIPTGSGQFGIYSGIALLTGDTATSDKHLFTALYNSTSSELFIDRTSEASGDVGGYSMDAIVIGANHDKASNHWLGTIQEIIIYNSDQSANQEAIETNINNHYDIY